MRRRTVLAGVALLPQTLRAAVAPDDQWRELAAVWNPFAEKMNQGIVDAKGWEKVLKVIHKIEGRSPCRDG